MLLVKIVSKWTICKINVEAAFMNRKSREEHYVELPRGLDQVMKVEEDCVGKLNKALYGLKQAARAFYDTIRRFLTSELKLKMCMSDSCLLCGNEIIFGLYVDDMMVIGKEETVKLFCVKMKKGLM